MFKSKCLLLCLCFVVGSYGHLAPFIDKCEWNNNACLVASSQKAVPILAAGLKDLGLPPFDPLKMDKVTLKEGELTIDFEDMTVTGIGKCKVIQVERNLKQSSLLFKAECPVDVVGTYTGSGKLIFVPFEGHGKFQVKTNNVLIVIKATLGTVTGADGEEHWTIGEVEQEYTVKEKAHFTFENLFNGDKSKAEPIEAVFDQSWKELMHTVAKPIVTSVVNKCLDGVKIFIGKVPTKELEK